RPRPLRQLRESVPPHVEAAVLKALAKVPADRFQTAAQFVDALARPGWGGPLTTTAPDVAAPAAGRLRRLAGRDVAPGAGAVPAAGGDPRLLLKSDTSRGESYAFPHYLPGAKALLLQIRSQGADRLGALTLATGKLKRFEQTGSNPRYVSSGHVVLGTRTGRL